MLSDFSNSILMSQNVNQKLIFMIEVLSSSILINFDWNIFRV